jgi:hypothetical protein
MQPSDFCPLRHGFSDTQDRRQSWVTLASELQSYDDVLSHFTVAGSTLGPVVTFDSVSIRRMLGLLLPVT